MSQTNKNQKNLVAIITMFFIFAMISFVTNMAAPFGNIWGMSYNWAGMAGNLMNFTAYLIMGIPAGNMLIKYGYKKTALIALIIGAIGLGVQLLSGVVNNIFVYLLGALICGFCVCMLNTVVNPMLNLLGGGGNTGNQLVQAGGTLNSLSATATPILTGFLVGTLTKDSFPDVAPLIITGIVVFLAAFFVISAIQINEPQGDLKNVTYEKSPLAFRHCLLGIIAIFFYVGIEIATPGMMNQWISREGGFEGAAAVAGSLAGIYWFLMLCGRLISTVISGKVSTRAQMITVSTVGIALIVAAIFTGDVTTTLNIDLNIIKIENATVPLSCVFIFLCGLCTSVMWGGIFNLSTEGLGKYTAKASGLFMVMVFGGGMMPFFQDLVLVQQLGISYLNSYWLIVAMLAYILYYAIWGCKNVNKDIKVD
ncbi:MFS transporter [Prevotella sp. P5-126]|uniref:MFS transporter n=1 Tax=Xylanibacter brevis TaxID=83231 RepID=A0ABS9CJ75_9BACT|nr:MULTISPECIES: MFS transporter [Prevotellaceae]MBS7319730.1 MFS transporter [Prevotella sp.]MCF2558795.1 MFS transporter [Xylanibacter brevis]MCF2564610.1 MFS transporter [Xylanibacter brevis]MCI7002384.1 MFS transporter [Prevotella sp.]MDD7172839.1 MFS transporter [Prevotella sp.]